MNNHIEDHEQREGYDSGVGTDATNNFRAIGAELAVRALLLTRNSTPHSPKKCAQLRRMSRQAWKHRQSNQSSLKTGHLWPSRFFWNPRISKIRISNCASFNQKKSQFINRQTLQNYWLSNSQHKPIYMQEHTLQPDRLTRGYTNRTHATNKKICRFGRQKTNAYFLYSPQKGLAKWEIGLPPGDTLLRLASWAWVTIINTLKGTCRSLHNRMILHKSWDYLLKGGHKLLRWLDQASVPDYPNASNPTFPIQAMINSDWHYQMGWTILQHPVFRQADVIGNSDGGVLDRKRYSVKSV